MHRTSTSALKQGNTYVADQYLRYALKVNKERVSSFPFIYSLVKLYHVKALRSATSEERIEKICKGLKFVQGKKDLPAVRCFPPLLLVLASPPPPLPPPRIFFSYCFFLFPVGKS
jgi:hypothetical protein